MVLVCEAADLPRLGDALDSVLGQGHAHLEVLLCPVAVSDEAVSEALAGTVDVRLVRLRSRLTWPEAAARGARAARGEHLLFLRGCDVLAPGAIARAAGSLAVSGSDVATGLLEQTGLPEPWLARAQREAHAEPGQGLAPFDRPALAGDVVVGNKLVRRRAWPVGPGFGPDEDWLLSPTVARVLASARRVDVLDTAFVTHAHDHGFRAFSATPSPLPGLLSWQRRVAAVAAELAGSPLDDAWEHRVAGVELPRLLVDAERANDEQWATLHELAADLYRRVGPAPPGSGVAARSLVWLAAEDRRADVALLAAELLELGDDVPTESDGDRVLAVWTRPGRGLPTDVRTLGVAETPVRAHAQRTRWSAEGREVDLLIAVRHVDLGPGTEVAVEHDGVELAARPLPDEEATRWAGQRFQRGVCVRVTVPGPAAITVIVSVRRGGVVRRGSLLLAGRATPPPSAPVVVSDVGLDGDVLVVRAAGDLDAVRILDPRGRPVAVPADVRADEGVIRFELRSRSFGSPVWLGSGSHRLVADRVNVGLAPSLRERLPPAPADEPRGERHRLRPHVGARGGLVLGLDAPLADDELGPFAQERLRADYARTDAPVDAELFYFETYTGRTATDSPLAILRELRRRRPGLRALWGIRDHSQQAPEGTTPVLLRSRAWYEALATAGVLVLNTDVEAWFRRRPGQFLLQTFHGHPSKAMGQVQWNALDLAPSRVAALRARGVDTWSAILTPSPEMTRHYREQYSYDGPALERGYPRDDDLVAPGAESRRRDTRRALGIEEHLTAVLYAPTWREHLATRPRAAAMTDHLDVAAAAQALPDHVLMVRGHRFHTPEIPDLSPTGRVLDVTAYPEINDLVLASDAAVLDYSSLRFDYALTCRPMVFLVPDLEEYGAGSRSFLFPFADTAPGPFVRDTAEVVAALRDLPGLRARYADAIAAVNTRYNPWQDGHAAERVVDGLLALLAGASEHSRDVP